MITTQIDQNKIWTVLEHTKLLKSEFVYVPQMLLQQTPLTSIMGLSYDCIVTIAQFYDLKNPSYYELWSDTNNALKGIVLEGKSVNQFIQDHRVCFGETEEFHPFYIYSDKYFTGEERGIGCALVEPKNDETINGPTIKLFPHDPILGKINSMLFAYENSSYVVRDIDLSKNEEFLSIINSKAGVGATLWVPKIGEMNNVNAAEYSMSLTGTLLNVAKGDTVKCTIKDRITGRSGYNFIVRFDVIKPKKNCTLTYYMLMLKVGRVYDPTAGTICEKLENMG